MSSIITHSPDSGLGCYTAVSRDNTSDISSSDESVDENSLRIPRSTILNTDDYGYTGRAEVINIDSAVLVEQTGAGSRTNETFSEPPRLLITSSRVKFQKIMEAALLTNVRLVVYKHEQCDLDGILSTVAKAVGASKFESIAILFHCTGLTIHLCGLEERMLTRETIIEMSSVREFFATLVDNHIDKSWVNARIDLLQCPISHTVDSEIISNEISHITQLPCGISKDLHGTEILVSRIAEEQKERPVGSLYFRIDKLRPTSSRGMSGFEKIRTVGKGAFGSAVLYRKKDDDSLVILKEVNMHDLNASERQMALNEVKVLAMMDHPNIITYFDSFEEDGLLMIEMDYADGGTLAQYLSNRDKPLDEATIIGIFRQMVAAINHMHSHNILHRDLKTANIFLTKDGVVKIGDFGISKLLTTGGKAANTLVGTPYYISPEMCEGKPYGPKSDIWSLGCILYEMACLERTFEASNLPAVVNKIVKGVYNPVKGNYSTQFKELVERMLDNNPSARPSAEQLWSDILPHFACNNENILTEETEEDLNNSTDSKQNKKAKMSALYYLTTHNLNLSRITIPDKLAIKDVAVGVNHAILVAQECIILSFGRGTEGQLGHGDELSRSQPTVIEALKGKSINRAACGDGFSVFSSSNGIVITCGDGQSGCLGHGDYQSISKPKLIETLLHVDVVWMDCGSNHVAVVGSNGEAYTWGNGSLGKLGLGSEENVPLPQRVTFAEQVKITKVFCGETGTMFLTDVGSVWACGSNKFNKLGLNNRQGFLASMKSAFKKMEVDGSNIPLLVRDLCRFRVIHISMGCSHTAVLTEGGKVILFGRNLEGQLGSGDTRIQQGLVHVKPLQQVHTLQISCTSLMTIVRLASGQLLFWGSRYKTLRDPERYKWLDPTYLRQKSAGLKQQGSANSSQSASGSHSQLSLNGSQRDVSRQNSGNSMANQRNEYADSKPFSDRETPAGGMVKSSSQTQLFSPSPESTTIHRYPSSEELECQLEPTPLINLLSEQSESVQLISFSSHGENVFVLVETTAPPTLRKAKKQSHSSKGQNKPSESSREAGDEASNSEVSEMDTFGTMPHWVKQELEQAEFIGMQGSADEAVEERKRNKKPKKPSQQKPVVKESKPSGKATVFTNHGEVSSHKKANNEGDDLDAGDTDDGDDDDNDNDNNSSDDVDTESHPPEVQGNSQSHKSTHKQRNPRTATIPTKSQGNPQISKVVKAEKPASNTVQPKSEKEKLLLEIQRLKQEAQINELRMSELEESYKNKVENVKHETAQRAAERERSLHEEMKVLREELVNQNKQMRDNFNLVMNLQEQLLKLQNNNDPSKSGQADRKKGSSPTAKSSICTIQ